MTRRARQSRRTGSDGSNRRTGPGAPVQLERRELVLDMVEQVPGVAGELSLRPQVEAAAKRLGGAFVRRAHVDCLAAGAARALVSGELAAPAEGIPETGIVRAGGSGALEHGQPFGIRAASRNEQRADVLERLRQVRRQRQRATAEVDAARGVMRGLARLRLGKQRARLVFGAHRRSREAATSGGRASAGRAMNGRISKYWRTTNRAASARYMSEKASRGMTEWGVKNWKRKRKSSAPASSSDMRRLISRTTASRLCAAVRSTSSAWRVSVGSGFSVPL